jgi:hypothetical protein
VRWSSRGAHRTAVNAVLLAGVAVIVVVAVSGGSGGNQSKHLVKPGWGAAADAYLGRYRLLPSGRGSVSNGELTVFMRAVGSAKPPVPSGILALHGANESDVFYLTNLTRSGSSRLAKVHIGSFLGPVIGRLLGTSSGTSQLVATVAAPGGARSLHFVRFSSDPRP